MVRKHEYRIYGSIKGLADEQGRRVADELPLEDVSYARGELAFEHEGVYVDLETILELISSVLLPGSEGRIDYIDNAEWCLTRYTISGTNISERRVDLNDALDKYIYE
jgi:hypothetical protein